MALYKCSYKNHVLNKTGNGSFFFLIQFISEIYLFHYFYFMEVIGNKMLFFSNHLKKIIPAFKNNIPNSAWNKSYHVIKQFQLALVLPTIFTLKSMVLFLLEIVIVPFCMHFSLQLELLFRK